MQSLDRIVNDQIKKKLTKRLLDIAEELPVFQGGFLERLQSVRKRQRQAAERSYAATRAPAAADFMYSGFRLFELFPTEENEALSSGLRKLFPFNEYGTDRLEEFKSVLHTISASAWSNIGTIVRDSNSYLAPFQIRVLRELPEEVMRIEVSVHKILPSTSVLVFDVFLSEDATIRLKALHGQRYLPEVWFHNLLPWRRWALSEANAGGTMQRALLEWQMELHSKVERILTSYLRGFFYRSVMGQHRLPAIDVFMLAGIPTDSYSAPAEGVSPWLQSLAVSPRIWSFNSYVGENSIFTWRDDDNESLVIPYRLIETYSEFPKNQGEKSFERRGKLDALLPYLCLIEAIGNIQIQLEELRIHVYRALVQTGFIRRRLRKEMRLNDQVQKEAIFIDRLALELKETKPWFRQDAHILRDMLRPYAQSGQERINLTDMVEGILTFQFDRVSTHLAFVAKMFADYVARRNLAVMFRLQQQVFFITIIATIGTILGLIGNWDQLSQILHNLWGHLRY